MTDGGRVAAQKNSPNMTLFQSRIMGGSVLYAPLVCGSVHIDDLAAVSIVMACAALP